LFVTLLQGVRQLQVTSSTPAVKPAAAAAAGGVAAEPAGGRNVWLERHEFYNSAVPRDSEEEEKMLQAALELSKLEHSRTSLQQNLSSVLSLHYR